MRRNTDAIQPVAEGAATVVTMAQLHIQLLGGFEVTVEGRAIPAGSWRLRKAAALVKVLALTPGHRLHREQILDQLWAESDPASAVNNLHYTLHVARRLLDPDKVFHPLPLHDDSLSLEGLVTVDLETFEEAASRARASGDLSAYRDALARYGGDLLPDDRYEDWTVGPRERAKTAYLTLRSELAALLESRGDMVEAINQLQAVLRDDPALEDAHVGLMRIYAASGQRQQALRQYEELVRVLDEELGVEPDFQTQQLAEQIRTRGLPGIRSTGAPPAAPASSVTPRHNLPATLTSFVGREVEMAEVLRLLGKSRLVTVMGPGGAGKTRLSLEVARQLVAKSPDAYPHGVWLVELGSLRDPALLPETVSKVLSVPDNPNQSRQETLIAALRQQHLLLLLDNCEHLVDVVAPLVQALLQSCSQLHILATSREAMHVPGEVTGVLPPLSLPDARHELHQADAVQLFVTRACDRQPHFALSDANAPAISAICRQVDGMPLAIELAAARVGMLTLEGIASRLADSMGFLTAGSRTAEPRQQTLKGALDWSYALLDAEERELFGRLAVFAGGWTLEAAEALGGEAVLDVLSRLVDKSLVVAEASGDGTIRFRFLEPIRQYAQQRLEETGQAAPVRLRHAALFQRLAEQAQPELLGPAQVEWLDRLDAEHDNLRAALYWCVHTGHVEIGSRLAGSIWRFWFVRGYVGEGRRWLDGLLSAAERAGDSIEAGTRAKALNAAGALAYYQSDFAQAMVRYEAALVLRRQLGDEAGVGALLANMGLILKEQGDYARAESLYSEDLALKRRMRDKKGISYALNNLGIAAQDQGDFVRAEALHRESLALKREIGDLSGIVSSLNNLACMAIDQGDHAQATALLEESLTRARELGLKRSIVTALVNLGRVARAQGRLGEAQDAYRESLALVQQIGDKGQTARCLEGLATVAQAAGLPQQAATLYGAAAALRDVTGAALAASEQPELEAGVADVRQILGREAFDAAMREGHTMTLEQAVEYALAFEDRGTEGRESLGLNNGKALLTRREREIVQLVARGLTNREIASELAIAERTVDTHVSKILHKLNISSRTQIAVWMLEGRQISSGAAAF